jgi:tetratricopeptide (TPR) repeat protein
MFKLSPNKSDINLVFALQNQAETFRRQGKYMAAVETYAECLRIEEAYYGRKHEATIDTIFNLAVCLKEYNNSEDAVALLHEVVQSESVLNLKPISKAQSLLQLAECLNNLGLFGQAEEHITRAHELFDFDTLTDGDSLVQQVVKEMDRSRRGQYHLPEIQ